MGNMAIRLEARHKTLTRTFEAILGIVLLSCGCMVYLLFRSKSLYIHVWCEDLGLAGIVESMRFATQGLPITDFVKFSLPDGLYCAAYLLIMDSIWHKEKGVMKYITLSIVPIVTIASEALQYFGIVRGTFDILDMICYVVPPLAYIMLKINHNIWSHSGNTCLHKILKYSLRIKKTT